MEDGRRSNANKLFLKGCKSVLTSKSTEETMVNLASWEPRHGRFKFNHTWDEYVKIGTLSRLCAYKLEAINCYLKSDIQTPAEVKGQMREPCIIICSESGKILKELARTMRRENNFSPCNSSSQCDVLKTAIENLKSFVKGQSWWEEAAVFEIIPAAAVASQLIEIVTCVDKIAMAIHELSSLKPCESKDFVATSTPEQPRNTIQEGAMVHVSNGSNHTAITISD